MYCPDWFPVEKDPAGIPLEDRIDFCAFTLCPAEEGVRVDVDLVIGEEKIPADAFTGLLLKKETENPDHGKKELRELEITENGVYGFEDSPLS